jgi:hypothetical protein
VRIDPFVNGCFRALCLKIGAVCTPLHTNVCLSSLRVQTEDAHRQFVDGAVAAPPVCKWGIQLTNGDFATPVCKYGAPFTNGGIILYLNANTTDMYIGQPHAESLGPSHLPKPEGFPGVPSLDYPNYHMRITYHMRVAAARAQQMKALLTNRQQNIRAVVL